MEIVKCSMCGKGHNDATVTAMIAGEGGAICDGCIVLCLGVLQDQAVRAIKLGRLAKLAEIPDPPEPAR